MIPNICMLLGNSSSAIRQYRVAEVMLRVLSITAESVWKQTSRNELTTLPRMEETQPNSLHFTVTLKLTDLYSL